MSIVEVLKFGSSVLRSPGELPQAVDEIYRRWRSGLRVLAVVSAFEGVTDELMQDACTLSGSDCSEAIATYLATGEQRTAALLVGSLCRSGIPARHVDPREIGLIAKGPRLESEPVLVNRAALDLLWSNTPVLVLPGFFGIDTGGQISLFGRGGSDISALFLAAELGARCRLLKDVCGVFEADPARNTGALRFAALSWTRAIEVSGPLIQPKALRFAQSRALRFEVGRPNEDAGTVVGKAADERVLPVLPAPPLRVALLGCGVVGRGVYESIRCYPGRYEVAHVVVRDVAKYSDLQRIGTEIDVALHPDIDVVVVCFPGKELAHSVIHSALTAGKFVITANKAAVAAHGGTLCAYARGKNRRLWYSAAVGGALPALESLAALQSPVRELRGIINGTCGVVLDAWAEGSTRHDAIALAQRRGFAEENPEDDLSGLDSANKLSLMIEAAFGQWLNPEEIPRRGIDTIDSDPTGYKLIACATRTASGITAAVAPEIPSAESFLGQAKGAENRLEIELISGEILRLRGQGAGRWPTTVSVLGDLHEVARIIDATRIQSGSGTQWQPL